MAAAAVDDRAGGNDPGAGAAEALDHFSGAAAGGDHVLDHHDRLSRFDRETAPQNHLPRGFALGEDGAGAKSARHFVANDDAAQRGRSHGFHREARNERAQRGREQRAEMLSVLGMLEHQRALQVLAAVQTAGQAEMPAQIRAGLVEQIQNWVGKKVHNSLLYHPRTHAKVHHRTPIRAVDSWGSPEYNRLLLKDRR